MCQCAGSTSPPSDVDYSPITYNYSGLLFYHFWRLYHCLIPEYSPQIEYEQHIPYVNVVLVGLNYLHTLFNSINLYLYAYTVDILIGSGVVYTIIDQQSLISQQPPPGCKS